jgi:hypothetical protein
VRARDITILVANEEELAAVLAFLRRRRKQLPSAAGNGVGSAAIEPAGDSLLHLETEKPESLIEWLRISKVLSNELPIRIDQKGIHCRLTDGPNRQVVFDSRIRRELFNVYHLKVPVLDVTVQDAGMLLHAMERTKRKKVIRLRMSSGERILRVGEDYQVKLASCTVLKEENELEKSDIGVSLSMRACSHFWMKREDMAALFTDAKANASYVDLIAETGDLTIESHTESGDYSKTITQSYGCKTPSQSRLYYVDLLLRCLKASKCEEVTVDNLGSFLQIWFSGNVYSRRILILACKGIVEEPGTRQGIPSPEG